MFVCESHRSPSKNQSAEETPNLTKRKLSLATGSLRDIYLASKFHWKQVSSWKKTLMAEIQHDVRWGKNLNPTFTKTRPFIPLSPQSFRSQFSNHTFQGVAYICTTMYLLDMELSKAFWRNISGTNHRIHPTRTHIAFLVQKREPFFIEHERLGERTIRLICRV